MSDENVAVMKSGGDTRGLKRRDTRPHSSTLVKTHYLFIGKRPDERDDDPHYLARVYLTATARGVGNVPELRYWRGDFWRYAGGHYMKVNMTDLRADVTAVTKAAFVNGGALDNYGKSRKVTQGVVGNVIQALGSYVRISDNIDQPCWLGEGNRDRHYVAVANGLLDLAEVPPTLAPHTPEWFTLSALPVAFDTHAQCRLWVAFLEEILEGDRERIAILQEWFGYCLTSDTRFQKLLLAEGDGSNGKSVVADILTHMLGPENVAAVPLEQFGERFQLTATVGKLANICYDVGEIDRVAEGHLKQFTGGDRMYFDRKNQEPIHGYPTARVVLAANNRPKFSDRSGGLWRRLIVMPFRVVIPEARQDKHLAEKLKAELPGILNWALEGRKRLQANGHFTRSAVCEEAQTDYRNESNPAKVFLTQHCTLEPDAMVRCGDLYAHYTAWCKEGGFKALDISQFGREVKRQLPKVERRRESGAKRAWFYVGLRPPYEGVTQEDWAVLEQSVKREVPVA